MRKTRGDSEVTYTFFVEFNQKYLKMVNSAST